MAPLSLPRTARESLWDAGFAGIESALRWAAVEMELLLAAGSLDFEFWGDDGDRHFANFVAWCDSVLVGVDKAVKQTGDLALTEEWKAQASTSLRKHMRRMRNKSLKGREEVIPYRILSDYGDRGALYARRFLGSGDTEWTDAPLLGTCYDYLDWIETKALPFLAAAVRRGCIGPDPRRSDSLPFPLWDPWTPRAALELRAIDVAVDKGFPLTEEELRYIGNGE